MANQQAVATSPVSALHAAIIAAIQAQFPALKTVEAYRLDRKELPTPACLVEMTEMELRDADDPGTGQIAVEARFEAHLIVGFKTPGAHLNVRELAAALLVFARLQRWGYGGIVGPARVIGAWEDDFDPALQQYECWRVEWTNELWLGNSVWDDSGATPTPLYGIAPNIGTGHEADYFPLDGLAAP